MGILACKTTLYGYDGFQNQAGVSKVLLYRILYSQGAFVESSQQIQLKYVTGPEKTGLIYIKYTYSYYGAYFSFYTLYLQSVNSLGFSVHVIKIVFIYCV